MIELPEKFDSIFRYIEVVSQRAEQIIRGARPRTEVHAAKATLQARDDVDAGEVDWRILTQEELDAQRQAMVEQFRAEMDKEEEAETSAVPDVLPTSAADAGSGYDDGLIAEEDEGDSELLRLQRLLGMAGASTSGSADEDEDDEDDDDDGSLDDGNLDDDVELESLDDDGDDDEVDEDD